jgi:hypothetical protein
MSTIEEPCSDSTVFDPGPFGVEVTAKRFRPKEARLSQATGNAVVFEVQSRNQNDS